MENQTMDGLKKVREDLLQRHKVLTKTMEAFTKGNFKDTLRDAIFNETKKAEKRTKINKKPALMILMHTGEIVLKFDDPKDSEKFFEGK